MDCLTFVQSQRNRSRSTCRDNRMTAPAGKLVSVRELIHEPRRLPNPLSC